MEKYLIYIEYGSFEYTNYFTLIKQDSKIAEKYPVEKAGELFQMILKETNIFELDIVKEKNASDWDYQDEFHKNQIESLETRSCNQNDLCLVLNSLFDKEYTLEESDNSSEKTMISLLFSGKCFLKTADSEIFESSSEAKIPEQTENNSREITALADIIIKKYERMNKHG